jgi:hypothetical protein
MTSTHLEKIFLHYVLQSGELQKLVDSRFFESPLIRKVYELSKEFSQKYNQIPSRNQIFESEIEYTN